MLESPQLMRKEKKLHLIKVALQRIIGVNNVTQNHRFRTLTISCKLNYFYAQGCFTLIGHHASFL